MPISVLLPTCNCAEILLPTLDSIAWADEILVVDSFSTDATIDICRSRGARIIQHVYINSAKQKNWAVTHCKNEWVLQIDSDEVLEEGAREEIESVLAGIPPQVDAFRIPRKNYVLGRWMKHAGIYPDHQTRLFRRNRGRWQDREVHAHVVVPGEIRVLKSHIIHTGMPNLSKQVRNLDRYTRYEADQMRKLGRSFRTHEMLLRPPYIFAKRYFWQGGWKDGWRGLIICMYLAFYDFLSYAKLWELEELYLDKSPR